jgi:predicted nucleic acid-binding protein
MILLDTNVVIAFLNKRHFENIEGLKIESWPTE